MGRPTTRFRKVNEMDTITDAQVVNAASTGSQALSLDEAAKANLDTGVLLLCKESLITAIQDRRLHRGHLRVLAAIAMHMNSRTGKAWPGRTAIGATLGMPVKTVSNLLLELRDFGYLIAARQMVEEANNRNLMVYTFGNIDHDTIRREITKFIEGVRSGEIPVKFPPQREQKSPVPAGQSRPGGNSEVPSQRDSPVPAGLPEPKVPPQRVQKSRQDGDSNSKKELKTERGECSLCNLGTPHLCKAGFVISAQHDVRIPMEIVDKWRERFPALPDLEAKMEKLGSVILSRGIMHPGWSTPVGWMAGCLSDDNQRQVNDAKITNSRVAKAQGRTSPPSKPSRW
jgi:hypothetical protein